MYRFSRPAKYRKFAYIFLLYFLLSPLPVNGYWDLVLSGEKSFLNGDLDKAETLLEKALDQRPDDPRILSDLGRVYFHQGRFSDAEKKITEALQSVTDQEWTRCWSYLYMGRLYSVRNEPDMAYQYFLKAEDAGGSINCNDEAQKYSAYTRILNARRGLSSKFETGCCIFYYDDSLVSRGDLLYLGNRGQEFYDKTTSIMNISPDDSRIAIYLYPAKYEIDLWDAREVIARSSLTEVNIFYNGVDDMGHMEHEMAHIITAGIFNRDNLIPLLSEGIAEYLAGDPWGLSMDKWVKGFMINNDFIPVHQLLDPSQFRKINPILSYTEAGSFVKYLMNGYGVSRFRKIVGGYTTWEKIYDKSAGELEDEWLRSLSDAEVTGVEMTMIKDRLQIGDFYNKRSRRIWCPYWRPEVLTSWRAM